MTWRSVLISKSSKLSLKNQQMLIEQKEQKFTVPLEDIAVILVEHRETVITVPLLSALAQNGVTLLSCDEQFLPCGQWLPFQQYHRQLKILKLQLEMSAPLKKQLWQAIVQQKICNQAFVLAQLKQEKAMVRLQGLAKNVKSGDTDNKEAQAALIYFQSVFGKQFRRGEEDDINHHLNYAYTVLRSAVARALVAYGWLPSLGLFHRNELNAFNLADDFIEPFRPLVDLMVWDLWQKDLLDKGLTPSTKQKLIGLLHYQIQYQEQTLSVLAAIDRTVGSLQAAVKSRNAQLLELPTILPLAEHCYE